MAEKIVNASKYKNNESKLLIPAPLSEDLTNKILDGYSQTRKTTLRHCNINNCYSKAGSAIHIVNTNNDSKTGSAENTRVLIEDSTIEWNYAIGDNAGGDGGTIRTNGSCLENL